MKIIKLIFDFSLDFGEHDFLNFIYISANSREDSVRNEWWTAKKKSFWQKFRSASGVKPAFVAFFLPVSKLLFSLKGRGSAAGLSAHAFCPRPLLDMAASIGAQWGMKGVVAHKKSP